MTGRVHADSFSCVACVYFCVERYALQKLKFIFHGYTHAVENASVGAAKAQDAAQMKATESPTHLAEFLARSGQTIAL